jgi:hypothetical protein
MGAFFTVQLDGGVRVVDGADHYGAGGGQNALGAHHDRGVGKPLDVGKANQVGAKLIGFSFSIAAQGKDHRMRA